MQDLNTQCSIKRIAADKQNWDLCAFMDPLTRQIFTEFLLKELCASILSPAHDSCCCHFFCVCAYTHNDLSPLIKLESGC